MRSSRGAKWYACVEERESQIRALWESCVEEQPPHSAFCLCPKAQREELPRVTDSSAGWSGTLTWKSAPRGKVVPSLRRPSRDFLSCRRSDTTGVKGGGGGFEMQTQEWKQSLSLSSRLDYQIELSGYLTDIFAGMTAQSRNHPRIGEAQWVKWPHSTHR